MVKTHTSPTTATITLSPNRSMDWSEVKRYLVFMSIPALIIAVGWFIAGVWVILPFAGLELGLLTYFMYAVCYQNYRVQKITIERDKITLEAGIYQAKYVQTFSRPDCYLSVTKPANTMEKLELALVGDGQSSAIGDFLNPTDREIARRSLVAAGIIERSNRWWSQS